MNLKLAMYMLTIWFYQGIQTDLTVKDLEKQEKELSDLKELLSKYDLQQ